MKKFLASFFGILSLVLMFVLVSVAALFTPTAIAVIILKILGKISISWLGMLGYAALTIIIWLFLVIINFIVAFISTNLMDKKDINNKKVDKEE